MECQKLTQRNRKSLGWDLLENIMLITQIGPLAIY